MKNLIAAVVLIGLGAAGSALYFSRTARTVQAPHVAPAADVPAAAGVIRLSLEVLQRAGIHTATAVVAVVEGEIRTTGTVAPNAYRQSIVTPLVAGRVTRVMAVLGDRVTQGQPLAEIYSPELAEAQTAFLSMHAEFEVAHLELLRTEKLVAIGSSSTQDLERVRAEHTRHATGLESARSRLALLGMSEAALSTLAVGRMSATVSVPAPLSGVVTERNANQGVNVDKATPLFTVVDLTSVWVIGHVYERDLARVRVGSAAIVTAAALPNEKWAGRVSYIDPQITESTRTVEVRVELSNRDERLRLGMYTELSIGGAKGDRAVVIPSSAVQTIGARQFVYLPVEHRPGEFVEREVRTTALNPREVAVVSGLTAGENVVTEGSFLLRAEAEKSGPRRR